MGQGNSSQEVDMTSKEAKFVEGMIKDRCVVVFSKSYCPFCKMAKDVLDDLQAQYEVVELNGREDENKLQNILEYMTGSRTVPRVFVKGRCIGGASETKALYQSGKLAHMLRSCGAI